MAETKCRAAWRPRMALPKGEKLMCSSLSSVFQYVFQLCSSINSFVSMVVFRCSTYIYRAHTEGMVCLHGAHIEKYMKLVEHTGTLEHGMA
jgi:hypothetical protein